MLESIWIDYSGKDLLMSSLFLVYALTWLIQMIYFWTIYIRLGVYQQPLRSNEIRPVSVVIAARNEYHHMIKFLVPILEQDYPNFEVVVVNDASDDESEDYLKTLTRKYSHLNVLTIRSHLNFFRGKKFPLGLGIKAAKNEYLLLTDADCQPSGPRWIYEMQCCFDDKTQFVLGYSAYEKKPGLLNLLVRWDTVHIAMQYLSFALAGQPYMGVGRNLAYRKSFFESTTGFAPHYRISSGDDDIFVNQYARGKTTSICTSSEGKTISAAPASFSFWTSQKRRHLTTGPYYKTKHKFMLGTWSFSQILFVLLFTFLLVGTYNIIPVCSLILLRFISQIIVFKKTMIRLQEKKLLLFSPIFELFFIFFYPLLAFSNLLKRNHKWK